MTSYSLTLIDGRDFHFYNVDSGSQEYIVYGNAGSLTGQSWQDYTNWTGHNASFTYTGSATISLTNTADGTMSDDNTLTRLDQSLTINGTTYSAGTVLEDEFEVKVVDDHGHVYTMVAVSATVNGQPHVIGYTFDGDTPPAGTHLTYLNHSNRDYQSMQLDTICINAGTLIDTPDGLRPIEALEEGDQVLTASGGAAGIRWIGHRALTPRQLSANPGLVPIRIAAGALGGGLPRRDLLVSPQHRLLVRSRIVERMCDTAEALVAAKHLVGVPGITVDHEGAAVDYYHLLCEAHEVILAEGAPVETLLPGPMARRMMPAAQLAEITALFPELMNGLDPLEPARVLIKGSVGRKMAERHARNEKPLLQDFAVGAGAGQTATGKSTGKNSTKAGRDSAAA